MDRPAPRFAEQLSAVIGLIYETAADESLWPQLLEGMAGLIVAPQDAAQASLGVEANLDLARTLDLATSLSLANSDAQQYLWACLAPHFVRSQRMQQELQDTEVERDLLERVMDRLPLGMAIVDGHGRAISMNRAMVALAQAGSGLCLQAGHLASDPADALGSAINRVLSRQQDHACLRLGPGRATLPSAKSALCQMPAQADAPTGLSLWVSRFGQAAGEGRAMVLAASPGSRALSEGGLVAFFDLSLAEARLTQQLALGHSMEDAAKALGVSHNTAKTQLKKVFSKVGVKRQPELLQAIYASPLWLDMGPQSRRMQPRRATLQTALEGVDALPAGQGMRLPDGRWMAWSDSGDPQGWPVLLCHAFLHGQHDRHPDDSILLRLGIRLLIPERPGSGDSDAAIDAGIARWPLDVACMLEHLGIGRFGLVSWSMGAPYALAVAQHFGARVQALGLVSPVTPVQGAQDLRNYSGTGRMVLLVALYTPRLLPVLMETMVKGVQRDVYAFLEDIIAKVPPSEKGLFESPLYRHRRAAVLLKMAQRGAALAANETLLAVHGWKVQAPPADIPCKIWHGDADPEVHWHGAQALAQALGTVALTIVPRAGHHLMLCHWRIILEDLKAMGSQTAKERVAALV
jgi:pimeloyl-ACP methyl ester carboxylesterase/DNA-binding CsgD family transcriptional regulator